MGHAGWGDVLPWHSLPRLLGTEQPVIIDLTRAPRCECYKQHMGFWEEAMDCYLHEHRKFVSSHISHAARGVLEAQLNDFPELVIACVCKYGCHRSVCMATILVVGLLGLGFDASITHLSRPAWSRLLVGGYRQSF